MSSDTPMQIPLLTATQQLPTVNPLIPVIKHLAHATMNLSSAITHIISNTSDELDEVFDDDDLVVTTCCNR